ncbi:alpha-hydroxy-acid oxidizing protein [Sporosarcina sp. 179-K 3D1 HS]|uniref:alpha-hydroxy-acid oxidizing protein n=1 Tax=Sporosarcina sp. 179-K 3D1 HS TaxID=3232169 RepID=UPI00399EFFC8
MTVFNHEKTMLKNIHAPETYPAAFSELEAAAREQLEVGPYGYIQSGAGGEQTMRDNITSLAKYSYVPRFLNDVSHVETSVTLYGRTYPFPLLLAPIGVQKMVQEEGEVATAKAAAELGLPFIQSTVSSCSIEDIALVTGSSPKWYQLYWSQNEDIAYSMVKRAEKAGYEAIVLTVDTMMIGWREQDIRSRFSPLANGFGQGNYESDEVFMNSLPSNDQNAIVQGILENILHPSLSWKQVAELRKWTKLPILLKGILHPEDAKLAMEHEIDGMIVSNHGGRQLDGAIASIDALPEVVKVVDGKIPVLFDSGIRRGSDIVKAMALGADAVLVGRPYIYGLAVGGQAGVAHVLNNLLEEFRISMALSGVADVKDLGKLKIVKNG